MEILLYGFGGVMAFFLILLVAEPHRLLGEPKYKSKKVGSTYWGIYKGQVEEVAEDAKTIELKQPGRKERTVYGSSTYALGRGVNMSGR